MARAIKAKDPRRRRLIRSLTKTKRKFWRNVSEFLEKSRKNRVIVNLGKIDAFTENNDTVLIPGKVLSSGSLTHSVIIAAFAYSTKAKKQIIKAGGEYVFIEELIKRNPTGSKVKILT
ncbi:MAG: 50S ribosomal protein L18e [Promethearchaeota archaeon]